MKILFITHYAGLMGANRSLLHLLLGLRQKEAAQVQVWCAAEGDFTAALRKNGIDYRVLPFANWAYTLRSVGFWLFPIKWWQSQRKMPFFIEKCKEFMPDIIHSNSSVVSLGALLAQATNTPHVWHIREYGWLDYRLFFLLGNATKRRLFAQATAFIAISESIKKVVLKEVATAKIHVIYNGIGTKAALETEKQAKAAFNAAKNTENTGNSKNIENIDSLNSKMPPFTFLIIGLLHPAKNQLQALRAFYAFCGNNPNYLLSIVGTGRRLYEWQMRAYVWRKGIRNNVVFGGYTPDPSHDYNAADVVLLCSPHEAMGRVTAEAMAYSKPVIGYNGGATPELITPLKTGLLYDGTDTDLTAKMDWCVKNQAAAKKIGENAYDYVLQNFTDEQYTAQVWAVYRSILLKNASE